MKQTQKNLYRTPLAIIAGVFCVAFATASNAAVVQRGSTNTAASRPTISRGQATAAVRVPTVVTTPAPAPEPEEPPVTEPPIDTLMPEPTEPIIPVPDKSTRFDGALTTNAMAAVESDLAADALAEQIRRQRAALDSESAIAGASAAGAVYSNGNACDTNLRACMQSKCGKDYSKCKGDTDTLWGTKMDACRRDLPCTGHEYQVFAAEIKADRDANARLAMYNSIIECGNNYNDCILTQCGVNYNGCLGKSAGDAAISKCASIARECTQQDSGLAARVMEVFGTLRQSAEVQVQKDEQRLYALRDQMRSVCSRLGAMFDERSLDCVFTVEFYAGSGSTLYASKKAYAGDTFDCTQNWFGFDITTFKENAYRATREQTSATSAFMGAGLGAAAGMATSGMINRAIDTQKAKNALNKAKKEEKAAGGDKEITTDTKTTVTKEKIPGKNAEEEEGTNLEKTDGGPDTTNDPSAPLDKSKYQLTDAELGYPDGKPGDGSDGGDSGGSGGGDSGDGSGGGDSGGSGGGDSGDGSGGGDSGGSGGGDSGGSGGGGE